MHLSQWHIMCMQIPPPWLGCVDTMTNITAMGAVGAMGIDSQWWGYEKTITNTTTELCDYHNQHHRLCKHHKQHPTSFQCYQQHCRYRRRRGQQRMRRIGWHHWFNGHEFEQAPGNDGQGSLACCSPWGLKESDTTEPLNNIGKEMLFYSGGFMGQLWAQKDSVI